LNLQSIAENPALRRGDEPNLAIDYNNLCAIYQARGRLDEAEKWVRKAISLMEPKGPLQFLRHFERIWRRYQESGSFKPFQRPKTQTVRPKLHSQKRARVGHGGLSHVGDKGAPLAYVAGRCDPSAAD